MIESKDMLKVAEHCPQLEMWLQDDNLIIMYVMKHFYLLFVLEVLDCNEECLVPRGIT